MRAPAPDSFRVADEPRSAGWPLVGMRWHDLLFVHWRVEPARLRNLLPPGVEPDLHDGAGWIGLVPFTMPRVRVLGLAIPGAHAFHECNVRTYVRIDGVPGVWFFSLDAASRIAVRAARITYGLPYHHADIALNREADRITYRVRRRATGATAELGWQVGPALPASRPGSLEWFLTERYCLYLNRGSRVCRGRIWHPRWRLREARLLYLQDQLVPAAGIIPDSPPQSVLAAEPVDAHAWRLRPCEGRAGL